MSQSNPTPADQPPTSPVSADQSCKEHALLAGTTNNDQTSAKALLINDPRPGACLPRSRDLATRILAQAQHDFASMEKHLALERQAMKNIAAMIPRVPPHPAYLFQDMGLAAVMKVAPQPIMATYRVATLSMSQYKAQQLQSLLQPICTVMDDFHQTAAAASTVASILSALAESVRSNFTVDIEPLVRSFRSVVSSWEILPPPEGMFPALNFVNQFPPIHAFLPDLGWLTNITDHINTLVAAFPGWPPLDLKRLKERIRHRLVAAFRSLGLCFAPSMSEDLMYQIVDLLETSGRRSSITLLIWNYYARNNHARLWQAVERWRDNPEYARRWRSILLPAFQAHTRGDYGLSISALAPLVEGIASHVVEKNVLLPAQKPRRGQLGLGSTKSVILRTLSAAGDEVNLDSDTTDLTHWVRVKSVLAYIEDVFCEDLEFERDYDYLHRHDLKIHRHGLLHGIQTNAMTALNSLRLFLLLDTMHDLLQTYLTRGGIM